MDRQHLIYRLVGDESIQYVGGHCVLSVDIRIVGTILGDACGSEFVHRFDFGGLVFIVFLFYIFLEPSPYVNYWSV